MNGLEKESSGFRTLSEAWEVGGGQTGTGPGDGQPGAPTHPPWLPSAMYPQPQGEKDRVEGDIFLERKVLFMEERETSPTESSPSQEQDSWTAWAWQGPGPGLCTLEPTLLPPGSLGRRKREQLTQHVVWTVPQAVGGRLCASVLSSRGWWQLEVEGPSSSPWGPGCPKCHSREVCQALA